MDSLDGFCDEVSGFHSLYEDADLFIDLCTVMPYNRYITGLSSYLGFRYIDFGQSQVTVDEESFRKAMDIVKLYHDPQYDVTNVEKRYRDDGKYLFGGALILKNCLFDDFNPRSFNGYQAACRYLREKGEEPVLLVQSNWQNGVTAELSDYAVILESSPNKANAWRLLKILLSEDIQAGHDPGRYDLSYFWSGFPVRRDSLKMYLNFENDSESVENKEMADFITAVQSPTEAISIPIYYRKTIAEEFMPYFNGNKPWDDCWKRFINSLELYKDE